MHLFTITILSIWSSNLKVIKHCVGRHIFLCFQLKRKGTKCLRSLTDKRLAYIARKKLKWNIKLYRTICLTYDFMKVPLHFNWAKKQRYKCLNINQIFYFQSRGLAARHPPSHTFNSLQHKLNCHVFFQQYNTSEKHSC